VPVAGERANVPEIVVLACSCAELSAGD